MSSFVPTNNDLRTALVFCYHLKKIAAESHRMLVEAYGEHALGKTQCFEWFKKFKSGNFDVRNEDRRKPPKKFEDNELSIMSASRLPITSRRSTPLPPLLRNEDARN